MIVRGEGGGLGEAIAFIDDRPDFLAPSAGDSDGHRCRRGKVISHGTKLLFYLEQR